MQRSGHFHLCTVAAVGVAYPTVFYAEGLDGRIDDPNAGGKPWALEVKRWPRAVASRRRQGRDAHGGAFSSRPQVRSPTDPHIDRRYAA
jgi:hypothetical protein